MAKIIGNTTTTPMTPYDDSAIYDELETIDLKLSKKQNTANTFTDIDNYDNINLDEKTQYYHLNSTSSDILIQVWPEPFMEEDEFTFYIYLEISSETPATVEFIFHNPEEFTECYPSWLEIPTIDYPHIQTLFAFQTLDKGHTWTANQCYSRKVR